MKDLVIHLGQNSHHHRELDLSSLLHTKLRQKKRFLQHSKIEKIENENWESLVALSLDNNGNVYLADDTRHEIFKYDPQTKSCTVVVGSYMPIDNNDSSSKYDTLHNPTCMSFDGDDIMYIGEWAGRILKCDIKQQKISLWKTTSAPWLQVVNSQPNSVPLLYYADNLLELVSEVDLHSMKELAFFPYPERNGQLWCFVVNPTTNEMFVSFETNAIYKVNMETGESHTFLEKPTCSEVAGLYFYEGTLFFSERTGLGCIKKLNLSSGEVTTIAELNSPIQSIVGDPEHCHCLYACSDTTLFKLH